MYEGIYDWRYGSAGQEVLRRQNADRPDGTEVQALHPGEMNAAQEAHLETGERFNGKSPENQGAMALITDTLSAFRGE